MKFVQKDPIDCPRLPVGQNYGFTDEVNPRLLEVAKNGESYLLPRQRGFFSNGLTPSQDGSPKVSRRLEIELDPDLTD